MKEIFPNIPEIKFEGKESKNPFAFHYYNPDQMILGKPMKEHLPFAMAWWHNLGATGVDMFGAGPADKSFGAKVGTMEHAKAKVDAGFEFMKKLGIRYFCFHDVDLVPECADIKDTNKELDEISDYILEKMKGTDIKCLWGTANMFSNPRFCNGAGSTNSADVFACSATHASAMVLVVQIVRMSSLSPLLKLRKPQISPLNQVVEVMSSGVVVKVMKPYSTQMSNSNKKTLLV